MESGNTQEKLNITTSADTLHGVLNLMERVKGFIDNHGLKGTFTSLMTLFIAAIMGFFIFNPSKVFEAFEEFNREKHDEMVKARIDADPYIRHHLIEFINDVDADRVFILETHNGGANLTNLPFLYVDMTYAEPANVLTMLESEYKNVRLSRYPMANLVSEEGSWFGNVEEMKDIDPELYYRLHKEGAKYVGFMIMYGKHAIPSGVLGVVYTNEDDRMPSKNTIIRYMHKCTSVMSQLLSNQESK